MEPFLGFCGLDCSKCTIFQIGKETDAKRRVSMQNEVIRTCEEVYHTVYSPGELTGCDGCSVPDGAIFTSCRECKIRKCAIHRNFISCAYCTDYVCPDLQLLFNSEPAAKERLDMQREKLIF